MNKCIYAIGLVCLLLGQSTASGAISARLTSRFGVTQDTFKIALLLSSPDALGGVDFMIRYDDTLVQFISVEPDSELSNWEYFLPVHDPTLNTVRTVMIANLPGPGGPSSDDLRPNGVAFTFRFVRVPEWTDSMGFVPFRFHWKECGDNSVADSAGFTLYVINRLFSPFGTLIWDETDNVNFPESGRLPNIGLPDSCINPRSGIVYNVTFEDAFATQYYLCGNVDGNLFVNIGDVVFIINYIFNSGAAPEPLISGDANCDGFVNIADALYLINYVFNSGAAPCNSCGI